MEEFLLVAAMCSQSPNKGCDRVFDLHLSRNAELRNSIKFTEEHANAMLGKNGKYILQVAGLAMGKEMQIKLDKYSTLMVQSNGVMYKLEFTFP
ncbi:MAG: hypothetical protein ACKOWO_08025 [Sediminibacterium sp.]